MGYKNKEDFFQPNPTNDGLKERQENSAYGTSSPEK